MNIVQEALVSSSRAWKISAYIINIVALKGS